MLRVVRRWRSEGLGLVRTGGVLGLMGARVGGGRWCCIRAIAWFRLLVTVTSVF